MSSSWVPCSAIRPCSSTTIRPAWRIVDRRWAITIAVRPDEQAPQALLDAPLGVQVDVGGGLVEHQDARVGDQRAGERDQLALSGGELRAALTDLGVVAAVQFGDELVDAHRGGRRADLLLVGVGAAEGDVLTDVPENRKASCGTIPICERSEELEMSRRSCPSTSTRPSVGS